MPYTVHCLKKTIVDKTTITLRAKADYGFDQNIYAFSGNTIPSNRQMIRLFKKYRTLLVNEKIDVMILHQHFINKTLATYLGDDFYWVKTSQDM